MDIESPSGWASPLGTTEPHGLLPRSVETRLRAVKRSWIVGLRWFLRVPPRGRSSAWMLALGIGLILAVQPMWPNRTAAGIAGAIGVTLLAATRWRLRWLPAVVLVASSISLRWSTYGELGSDVSDVTRAAIQTVLQGGNPYGIGYAASRPPGARCASAR